MSIIRALVIRDTLVNFTFSVLLRVMFSKDESLTHLLFENIKLFSVYKLYQGFKNLQSNIYSCTFCVGVSRCLSDRRIHVPVQETQEAWVGKIPWRRKWQPIPVFLPRESHGQRSLVGYIVHGVTESDMTVPARTTHLLS